MRMVSTFNKVGASKEPEIRPKEAVANQSDLAALLER